MVSYIYIAIIVVIVYLIVYYFSYDEKSIFNTHVYPLLLSLIAGLAVYWLFKREEILPRHTESADHDDDIKDEIDDEEMMQDSADF